MAAAATTAFGATHISRIAVASIETPNDDIEEC